MYAIEVENIPERISGIFSTLKNTVIENNIFYKKKASERKKKFFDKNPIVLHNNIL